jgi:hypothetical protein
MDALAQSYGSDSSDPSESRGKESIGGILAAYNDSDTDGLEESFEKKSPYSQVKRDQDGTLNGTEENCIYHSKKKQMDESSINQEEELGVDTVQNIHRKGLPNPVLLEPSSTSQYLFPKNYLHGKKRYQDMDMKLNATLMKLQQDDGSFAQHLKQQKEFGNKSIFNEIIDHFKIHPMGSNIDKNNFGSFEYIERLLVKEEENRLRMSEGMNETD